MAASWSSPPWAARPFDDSLPRPRPGPLNPNLIRHEWERKLQCQDPQAGHEPPCHEFHRHIRIHRRRQ